MAPMAFMLARVGRNASARSLPALSDAAAALPAAAAASRSALYGKTKGNRSLGSLAVASKHQFFGWANHVGRRPLSTRSSHGVNSVAGHAHQYEYQFDIPGVLKVDDKDLVSDEALWALYLRWCKYFKVERSHEEMTNRFDKFKGSVRRAHDKKKSNKPFSMGINSLADRSPAEIGCKQSWVPSEHYLYCKAMGGYTITFGSDDD